MKRIWQQVVFDSMNHFRGFQYDQHIILGCACSQQASWPHGLFVSTSNAAIVRHHLYEFLRLQQGESCLKFKLEQFDPATFR
jgi:hypothetical protein